MRKLNEMFSVDDQGYLVKTSNGERVPDDEPIFILRARDSCAYAAIRVYVDEMYEAGAPLDRIKAVQEVSKKFEQFGVEHQDRVKIPGVTHGK